MKKSVREDIITLEIELLSPLHIGTGEELDFSSFIQKGEQLLVLDYPDLISEQPAIRKLIMETHSRELFRVLQRKLKQFPQLEKYVKHRIYLTREVADYFSSKNEAETKKKVKLLPGFNTGKRYIPGSSLKGALRTGLLLALLQEKYAQRSLPIKGKKGFRPRRQQEMAHRFSKTVETIESEVLNAKKKYDKDWQFAFIKVIEDFAHWRSFRLKGSTMT